MDRISEVMDKILEAINEEADKRKPNFGAIDSARAGIAGDGNSFFVAILRLENEGYLTGIETIPRYADEDTVRIAWLREDVILHNKAKKRLDEILG